MNARLADPIERIRHDITHAPAEHVRQVQPVISDFDCAMRYLWASYDWRIGKAIDAIADRELRAHWSHVEFVRRSIGQKFRRAA